MARRLNKTLLNTGEVSLFRACDELTRIMDMNYVQFVCEGLPEDCQYSFTSFGEENYSHRLNNCYYFRDIPWDKVDEELALIIKAHHSLLLMYIKLDAGLEK